MCGIVGCIRIDDKDVDQKTVLQMEKGLSHRGPDGAGRFIEGAFGLAMTRLAIIDVHGGRQPILNEDESLILVCNGEIYNYVDLRRELQTKGHYFRTESDVEIVLHLYEEYGVECFSYLNGMFALALHDMRNKQVVLARDSFGQKPLYVWRSEKLVAFASELKAFMALSEFPRQPDPQAISAYMTYRYIPAPMTIYDSVEKLPPGSYLVIDAQGCVTQQRFWQLDLGGGSQRDGVVDRSEVRDQLVRAVERHMMSERPLGVFLSGGVDSSAIVACMHQLGHTQIKTYTVGFEGFIDNEFANARRVAEHFKTDHHEVTLTPETFWNSLEQVVWASDEPLADLTTIPLYHLARRARQDVVVVLSGEGSDELLAGYRGLEKRRRFFDRLSYLRPLEAIARTLLNLPLPEKIARRVRLLTDSDADILSTNPFSMTRVFDEQFGSSTMSPGFGQVNGTMSDLKDYYRSRQNWHGLNLILGAMIEWWLPDDLLHKADRMTMAHGLELRCPFLDLEFARFCAALSLDDKARLRWKPPVRKIALIEAFADLLPTGIALQKKKGFSLPAYGWLRNELKDRARSELEREDAFASQLLAASMREELFEKASHGDKKSQHRVWSVIILNKWGDRWMS